jgi:hypothetical protein
VVLLPPTSDTDQLNARAVRKVVSYRSSPARPLADDLPALVEATDMAVRRPLRGGRDWQGSPDARLVVPRSGFGEITANLTVITCERCVP